MEPPRKIRYLIWWQQKGERIAIWLIVLGFLLVLGFVAMRDHQSSRRAASLNDIVANVNGAAIHRHTFEAYLRTAYGNAALNELIDRELVEQAAEAAQVSLTRVQRRWLTERFRDDPQVMAKRAIARAEFLAQNLVMSRQTEDELMRFYELFADELRSFDFDLYYFSSAQSARSFRAALEQGGDADEAAHQWAHSFQVLDRLTESQVSALGLPTQKLRNLEPSKMLEFPAPSGLYLLRLKRCNQTFEEVQPEIAKIFFGAQKFNFMHQLRSSATITSPIKLPEPTPRADSTSEPKLSTPSRTPR